MSVVVAVEDMAVCSSLPFLLSIEESGKNDVLFAGGLGRTALALARSLDPSALNSLALPVAVAVSSILGDVDLERGGLGGRTVVKFGMYTAEGALLDEVLRLSRRLSGSASVPSL